MIENFCKEIISKGGSLTPLIISNIDIGGTGLMNPSIYNDNGRLLVNIRHINYILWHCENKQLFNSRYGPLVYFNPEDDVRLATKNYICTLNKDFTVKDYYLTDTKKLDSPNPLWEFHGLEDARIFRWDNKLFQSGVRRDTTPNGEGRMELSEIILTDFECTEVSRQRLPMPNDIKSYCEKNWMPIIDMPYHYVKWTNPTEIVRYDPIEKTTNIIVTKDSKIQDIKAPRGGSQVIPYKDYHIALVHEVDLFNNIQEQKDGIYRHRFIVWNKDWDVIRISEEFNFMDARIEFSCGMCLYKGDLLITFGFQDNASFLLQIPEKIIDEVLGLDKIQHIYKGEQFGEDWFTYPNFYKDMVNKFPSESKFVEVGSWKGKSSSYMATEIANSGKNISFYCVDKGEEVASFTNNMKPLEKYYTLMKMDSLSAAKCFEDRSLDFVFIDASHEYNDVKSDIIAWMPKVREGGILAGHDYHEDMSYEPGVCKAVNELINGFIVSEMCWIYEVKEEKLFGLPSIYCVSLIESDDRRNNLKRHFAPYHKVPVFCTFNRYKEDDLKIVGDYLDNINIHAKGSITSHLMTISAWYKDTKEEYGFFCEDDLSLETVPYWGFTWDDFISRLPLDWECIQLLQIRENWNNHKLKVRAPTDYCNAAYIVKRGYAKRLLEKYITIDGFNLSCGLIPVPENVLFTLGKVYSIPLFVEDIPNTTTTFPGENEVRHSDMHIESYNEILNFWRDSVGKYTIKDFITKVDTWKFVTDPIFEITTNIHSNGCIINCAFCPQMTLISNYNGPSLLSLENFKTVIDKLPSDIGIIFAGFSEPWLNPDCTEMVCYANSKGRKISIFTTGIGMSLLSLEKIAEIPFASGLNRGFTLHLPDKEGYANHPITPKYIELLGKIRDSNIAHLRVVSMGTVPDIIKDIFPEVQKAEMYSRAGNLQKEEIFKPKLAALRAKYLSIDNGEGEIICASPEGYNHTVMLPNGDVSICCQDYQLQHIIGNLFTQEYRDIIPHEDASYALCRYCENGKRK
jgi:hypothetical protein